MTNTCVGYKLRRLYSTFAGSWPGTGLLLMRLVLGLVLLVRTGSNLWSHVEIQTTLNSVLLTGSGLLLIAGLWTPLAGTVIAVIEISQILTPDGDPLECLLTGTLAVALAMLGPGRWSVDARLFGWKRIEAAPRTRSSNAL
jgi:uncharacterized membrane protein YphA (DoxX/SURF4 family)